MAKYYIADTMPAYVTWFYEVEADDAEQAFEDWLDATPAPVAHQIGDTVSFLEGGECEVVHAIPDTAHKEGGSK